MTIITEILRPKMVPRITDRPSLEHCSFVVFQAAQSSKSSDIYSDSQNIHLPENLG